ncbi:MAG: glutamine synthetase [Xanthomonadales bacterium]|nr:glutamine synthetase [Xanthomonadales bacterium]
MNNKDDYGIFAAFMEQAPDTRYLELLVADMNGTLRGKRTDIEDAQRIYQNNVNWCAATLVLDYKGSTFDSVPMGGADGDPDLRAHIVPGTLAPVPWAKTPSAQAMVETTLFDGTPYFLDCRQVLRRALQPLTDLGLHAVMAAELEFYLVEHDGIEFAPRLPRIPGSDLAQDGKQYGVMEELEDVDDFLADVDAWCQAQNVPAGAALAEYAPGQFEINLHHVDDPLRACEHALMLKRVIKAAAKKHGLAATFMAKPFGGIPGSGLHVHISLLDDDGNNVFAGECSDGRFSETLRHAIGGLAATMGESMAIYAPNANSYRRFVRGAFVPCTPNWGVNHRGVALRIPLSSPVNNRVEVRVAGADANPYLVTAAIMAGLHHGITHRCDPGRMIQEREELEDIVTLPVHWPQALDAFSAGTILPNYLGKEFAEIFALCRREESNRFQTEVSNRDYEWYLRAV